MVVRKPNTPGTGPGKPKEAPPAALDLSELTQQFDAPLIDRTLVPDDATVAGIDWAEIERTL
jgi:hypothetical protein